jgi:hypothetical protein
MATHQGTPKMTTQASQTDADNTKTFQVSAH